MKTPTSGGAARLREFEMERWPAHARVMRAAAVVAMVLIPIGGLTDYAIAGATATTYTLVALRLVTSVTHIPIFMACGRSRPSPTLEIWIGLGLSQQPSRESSDRRCYDPQAWHPRVVRYCCSWSCGGCCSPPGVATKQRSL